MFSRAKSNEAFLRFLPAGIMELWSFWNLNMRGSKKCQQRRQIDTVVVFWGPGTSLGTLLCSFKKFESSREGRGPYTCALIMDSKEDYMGTELRTFFSSA